MSWTVVNDDGVIQVRASIKDLDEMGALIESLKDKSHQMFDEKYPKAPPGAFKGKAFYEALEALKENQNERHASIPADADVRGPASSES